MSAENENLSVESSFSDFDLCDEFDVCSVPETIKSSKAENSEAESDETKHSDYIIRTICSIDMENRGGNLEAQIEELLTLEKQMRLVGDLDGTTKAATDALQLCFDARNWKLFIKHIVLLSKRRGQFKLTIKAMVQQALQYIDQTPYPDTKAADLMQEVAVETIGSMPKTEKIAFLLEQVCFFQIIEEAPADIPSLSELKLINNQLMNRHYSYKNGYPAEPGRYIYVNGIRFVMDDDLPAFGRFLHGQSIIHCMRTSKHHFRHLLHPIQPRHQKRKAHMLKDRID